MAASKKVTNKVTNASLKDELNYIESVAVKR